MNKSEIRAIMKAEFLRGNSASQTARNINETFGFNVTTQQTVSNWFAKFRCGNFDLKNEPRGRPESKVDNYELKVIIESDPSLSAHDLAMIFSVSKQTILTHLAEIGKVKRFGKWVSNDLNENVKHVSLENLHGISLSSEKSYKSP